MIGVNGIDCAPNVRHVRSNSPCRLRSSIPARIRLAAARIPAMVASAAARIRWISAGVFTMRMRAIASNAFRSSVPGWSDRRRWMRAAFASRLPIIGTSGFGTGPAAPALTRRIAPPATRSRT